MNSIIDSAVIIQTSSHSVPSTPSWFGEVAVIAHDLERMGVLANIAERVRFVRRRFGRYEVIDFVAVLFGYAVSSERTLEAFYECLHPFAAADHWRSSDESACPPARRSGAFWRL